MATTLEQWNWMYAELNGRSAVGQPRVRDPEYPCDVFEPGQPRPNNDCDGDGHYMCRECARLTLCADGCGQRREQCECPDETALARRSSCSTGGWLRVTID